MQLDLMWLQRIGDSGDAKNSIPTLLQVLTRGPESNRPQVVDELGKFDPNLVKFYARNAKPHMPADQVKLIDDMMKHNFR